MLQNLHVKNLALIDEIEVDFQPGLNILTGETGAGKSILLGSIHLALGGRYNADMLRKGAKFGLVELMFSIENEQLEKELEAMDIFSENGMLVLTRKLMEGRSISKINGETVSIGILRDVASLLIDIHEQHEHQRLLSKRNHLTFLDIYAKEQVEKPKQEMKTLYQIYQECNQAFQASSMDEKERRKEIDLIEFELHEIEDAKLQSGEDEELEILYRKMTESKNLTEGISEAYQYTSEGTHGNASDFLSRAIRALQEISTCDETGSALYSQLVEIDSLLNDFNRELSEYAKSFEFSEEDFRSTENRLNEINHLKAKYGNTVKEILEYAEEKRQRLNELEHYESYIEELEKKTIAAKENMENCAKKLSAIRKKAAISFTNEIKQGLQELNFLDVQLEMKFLDTSKITVNGMDDAEFFISTNPGEPTKPLGSTASGGELSRIMLAIKTVLADKEDTPSLIFDEIDSGISGITAGKVAEKLRIIGQKRQVICITHLPQIAAVADAHYRIEKQAVENITKTEITQLDEDTSIKELARLLGGASITQRILESAREMKEMAKSE
ncbi:MAG: DNA repair protein RecN [Candidatus Ruminococcus intestinipullorum]|nr:DNA repair protein RecN [Candidatus Ruminococcus intestinipullorum]